MRTFDKLTVEEKLDFLLEKYETDCCNFRRVIDLVSNLLDELNDIIMEKEQGYFVEELEE